MSVALDAKLLAPVPRRADEARVSRVDDHAWCLRLPLPYVRTRSVNCYLLADGDGYVLVDCGGADAWDALEHALSQISVDPSAIHTLLLTHLHADHASLAATVVDRLGCRLLRGRGPDSLYDRLRDPLIPLDVRRRDAAAEGVPPADLDLITNAPLAGDAPAVRPRPDGFLDPGDRVPTDGADWRIIAAPGHSPAQIALYDPARRWIVAADVAYPGGNTYLEYGYTPDPFRESLDTVARVRQLDAARYLPGHGRPDDHPAARLDTFAAATFAFRDDCLRCLDAVHPRSAYAITGQIGGHDADPDQRGAVLSTVLCVLEHEIGQGRVVVAARATDGIRRFLLTSDADLGRGRSAETGHPPVGRDGRR